MKRSALFGFGLLTLLSNVAAANAQAYLYANTPTNVMAIASRPGAVGIPGIEAADDFLISQQTRLTGGSFTGLVPQNWSVGNVTGVTVEIYQVFPTSSNTARVPAVPTRVNSPSDVALASRSSGSGLNFTATILSSNFTANNSVLNGINPSPNQTTGGAGPFTGQEVQFDFTFGTGIDLAPDHYFFVAQVALSSGQFFWLSGTNPIAGSGTTPFTPDLQAWVRNDALSPDWLRVGSDIVGPQGNNPAPTFNTAFTLNGTISTVPEPSMLALVSCGLLLLGVSATARARRTNRPGHLPGA
jgi:hypothetical protein